MADFRQIADDNSFASDFKIVQLFSQQVYQEALADIEAWRMELPDTQFYRVINKYLERLKLRQGVKALPQPYRSNANVEYLGPPSRENPPEELKQSEREAGLQLDPCNTYSLKIVAGQRARDIQLWSQTAYLDDWHPERIRAAKG